MLKNINMHSLMCYFTLIYAVFFCSSLFISYPGRATGDIFLWISSIYFLVKAIKNREILLNVSTYFLFAFAIWGFFSGVLNHGAFRDYGNLKHIVMYVFAIFAFRESFSFFKTSWFKFLFLILILGASIASINGIYGTLYGYSFILGKNIPAGRNMGAYKSIMIYVMEEQFFLLLLLGVIAYSKELHIKASTKLSAVIAWTINFVGFIFSFTRGGFIAFAAGLPVLFFRNHKKKFFISSVLVVFIACVAILFLPRFDQLTNNFFSIHNVTMRVSHNRAAYYMFREHIILGVGYRNFKNHVEDIKVKYDLEYKDFGGEAHCQHLALLAETGLTGFILFYLFVICWLIESYRRKDAIGDIALAFIVTWMISGIFEYTFTARQNMIFILCFYSLTQSFSLVKNAQNKSLTSN